MCTRIYAYYYYLLLLLLLIINAQWLQYSLDGAFSIYSCIYLTAGREFKKVLYIKY